MHSTLNGFLPSLRDICFIKRYYFSPKMFLTSLKVYVEYGKCSKVRASSLLATGVKLSRMTEPGEEEWWKLGKFTKSSLEKLRESWGESERNISFSTKIFPLKNLPKSRKVKPKQLAWPSLPPSTVTEVSLASPNLLAK